MIAGLSPREMEVLKLLAEGKTNKEIVGSLYLAEGTVKTYLGRIYTALNVHTRSEATAVFMRMQGVVGPAAVSTLLNDMERKLQARKYPIGSVDYFKKEGQLELLAALKRLISGDPAPAASAGSSLSA